MWDAHTGERQARHMKHAHQLPLDRHRERSLVKPQIIYHLSCSQKMEAHSCQLTSRSRSISVRPTRAQVRFAEAHGPGGRLSAMVFDANQRRLLTGGSDGVLRFWNANNGSVLREACTLSQRSDLTAALNPWQPFLLQIQCC